MKIQVDYAIPTAVAGIFFQKMNIYKGIIFSLIALFLIGVVVLSACFSGVSTALFYAVDKYSVKEIEIDTNQNISYRVYVCGAVKNSGFYTFELGDTYSDVLLKAGLLDCSIVKNHNSILTAETKEIICSFMENDIEIFPININSSLFSVIYENANIEDDIALKIIDYLDRVEIITTKQQLLYDGVLTAEEWDKTFYRIYVGEKL